MTRNERTNEVARAYTAAGVSLSLEREGKHHDGKLEWCAETISLAIGGHTATHDLAAAAELHEDLGSLLAATRTNANGSNQN